MKTTLLWNSLEIAKLLVSILTPLTIVILGFLFNRRLNKLESERKDSKYFRYKIKQHENKKLKPVISGR